MRVEVRGNRWEWVRQVEVERGRVVYCCAGECGVLGRDGQGWCLLRVGREETERFHLGLNENAFYNVVICQDGNALLYNSGEVYLVDTSPPRIRRIPLFLRRQQSIDQVFFSMDSVLIVLNSGELLAWGDNKQGQLGLLLRMHYQKPEFVQANRRNVMGVKQALFLSRETVVVDGDGRILVCGRAGRYELNFQGFKVMERVANGEEERKELLVLGGVQAERASQLAQMSQNIISIGQQWVQLMEEATNCLIVYSKAKDKTYLFNEIKQEECFIGEQCAATLMQTHRLEKTKQERQKLMNLYLQEEANSEQDNYEKIQELIHEANEQKTIIQLQEQLISKLQQQLTQQQAEIDQAANEPPPSDLLPQQIIFSFTKISKLRRLLESLI